MQAARLLGTATRARESAGAHLPEAERSDVERIMTKVLATLGTETFAAEFAAEIDDDPNPGSHGAVTTGPG
ncbi:hypothetical protein GCM10012286_64630 [Streptomyces lasiicapitis]|uniref:Uncharacterized protein n=1 Tax=Streptomyces lasiicapitis TaxID=1923961 RepID=A0ABQ2MMV4_9ACTN|nr:hypothetical protein GCM10012286_64630 [Streptomyces lasiicapitis]